MAKVLASNEGHNISKENLHACVGIEVLLSQRLVQSVMKKRIKHLNVVLGEQLHQEELNIRDSEKLRQKSRRSSKESQNRSYKLAIGYWEFLNDGRVNIFCKIYCVITNVFFCFIVLIAIKDKL